MTIVVATYAPDGIILASDSRTIFTKGGRHRVATDHAKKLFIPCKGVGIACFGTALLGDQTIAGLVGKFLAERRVKDFASPLAVSEALADFFRLQLDSYYRSLTDVSAGIQPPQLPDGLYGFLVAGYVGGVGRVTEVLLPRAEGAITEHDFSTLDEALIYRGRTRYMRRMFEGYDRTSLTQENVNLGTEAVDALGAARLMVKRTISVQNALDLATFVVHTTIDMERLTDGIRARPGDVPRCGGQMQALLITQDETTSIAASPLRVRRLGFADSD